MLRDAAFLRGISRSDFAAWMIVLFLGDGRDGKCLFFEGTNCHELNEGWMDFALIDKLTTVGQRLTVFAKERPARMRLKQKNELVG
jgi:hypothetical protein